MIEYNYDEFCPIDKTLKSVVVAVDDGNESRLCLKTGYHSMSVWKDKKVLGEFETTIPQSIRDTVVIDDRGNVWYKIVLVSPFVMMFPEPNGTWNVSSILPAPEDHTGDVFLWAGKPFYVTNDFKIFDEFAEAFDVFNYIHNTADELKLD